MKHKALCIAAAAAMALTACRFSINSDRLDADYKSEADVHEWMAEKEYDAALMTQTGDTQRVVYLRFGSDTVFFNENYSGRDSSHNFNSHLLTAYLIMDDKAAGREVALSPLNDTTFRIDSATSLLLARPTKGREEELMRFASWSLYGFRDALETSLSNAADDMADAEQELETAAQKLEEMGSTLVDIDTVIVAPGCKAQEGFERLRKKAKAAGFGSIEIRHRPGIMDTAFLFPDGKRLDVGGVADNLRPLRKIEPVAGFHQFHPLVLQRGERRETDDTILVIN